MAAAAAGRYQPAGKAIDLAEHRPLFRRAQGRICRPLCLRDLFDGRPETSVTIDPPDSDVNVLVEFGSQTADPVARDRIHATAAMPGICRRDGPRCHGAAGRRRGRGQWRPGAELRAADRAGSARRFSLPPDSRGKGLWLRIGGTGQGKARGRRFQESIRPESRSAAQRGHARRRCP